MTIKKTALDYTKVQCFQLRGLTFLGYGYLHFTPHRRMKSIDHAKMKLGMINAEDFIVMCMEFGLMTSFPLSFTTR